MDFRRGPMSSLEIEDDDIGEVRAVFVLSTEYKELLVLPETSSVTYFKVSVQARGVGVEVELTHSHARNVAIVVDQTPLLGLQIESENMIVDFVGILVETTESIDLVIANVGDGSIHETGRPLTDGCHDGRHVGVVGATTRRVSTA